MAINQEEFSKKVGENLAKYRKYYGYTQIALAEKLNYSDKSVSKWESGESLPDVYVFKCIADIYGVTVNDLLTPRAKPKTSYSKIKAFFIPTLSCGIAWIVALLSFFIFTVTMPFWNMPWLTFIIAIPINFIIALVFACVYKIKWMQLISVSAIIWTTILTICISFSNLIPNINNLYLVGIPLQVVVVLWYVYLYVRIIIKNSKTNHN